VWIRAHAIVGTGMQPCGVLGLFVSQQYMRLALVYTVVVAEHASNTFKGPCCLQLTCATLDKVTRHLVRSCICGIVIQPCSRVLAVTRVGATASALDWLLGSFSGPIKARQCVPRLLPDQAAWQLPLCKAAAFIHTYLL